MLKTLQAKTLLPVVLLAIFAVLMTLPPVQQSLNITQDSWILALTLGAAGILAVILQSRSLGELHNLRERMQRTADHVPIGEPSLAHSEELHDIWQAAHTLQQRLEQQRSLQSRSERNIERLSIAIEHMCQGLDATEKLDVKLDDPAFKALLSSLQDMNSQLIQTRSLIEHMKRGELGAEDFKKKHLDIKRLTESDIPIPREADGLLEDLLELQNALRRLTLQTHLVASDKLESPLLNETVVGDLGDAYASMIDNLRILGHRAQQIARGDLSIKSDLDGSLHNAFNSMVEGLRGIVSQITQTAVRISTSAEEILAVLHEQELSASHQASGVEETQRTMETLLSSAKKIAESAQTVFKSAERTQANNRIISDRASELKSHTERIAEILESIKEIADRSDLLALNASLEGLRAGEAGKGFTLVANEMRRLAENIKGSVGDIKDLLGNIRQSALSNIMAIEEGSRLSERTTDSALKITLITQQQQSGTEQVTQSMEELSHLINQGLAGTRQVTTAASELAGLSDDMRGLVDTFNIHEPTPSTPQNWSQPTTTNKPMASSRMHMRPSHYTPAQGISTSPRQSSSPRQAVPQHKEAEPANKPAPKNNTQEKSALEATQLAIHTQLPNISGKEQLNATMRFVGYGDTKPKTKDTSPTLDISQMSSELLASDYEDMDSLFHELDASPNPSKPGLHVTSEPDTSEFPTDED